MIIKFDVFRISMKHQINEHVKSTKIVTKQLWWFRDGHTNIPKISNPCQLNYDEG